MKKTPLLAIPLIITPAVSLAADNDAKAEQLEIVVVTATREEKLKRDLPESVTAFNSEDIENISPSHPSELLNRSAGVYVNNLGGEGHMTAIRQPITTRGVYLFLEDGVPIRPTGFFNHNALYEVNIPQSANVEVVKGPGSALYGSDAIGGMINSLSSAPSKEASYFINLEGGSYGWKRGLVSASNSFGDHGLRLSLNYTENEGYRDESEYDRASLSGRWDFSGDTLSVKTLLSYTEVDQSGASSLTEDDYKNDTTKNKYHGDVGARDVEALRLSSEFAIDLEDSLLSFTPFYRNNTTAMTPSWMFSYDPNIRESKFESFGLLTKYRYDFNENNQLITGIDIDYTPSTYKEEAINPIKDGDILIGFTKLGASNYDFEAEQTTTSPYIQFESYLRSNLILTTGLRYDYFKVKYEDQLDASDPTSVFIPELGRPVTHRRPESQSVSFDQFSPKLGLVYQFNEQHDTYFNYRHAFTMPSVGTLFRSGSTRNTAELEPIKADNIEFGFRGMATTWFNYEVALYHMIIKDDLVTIVNGFQRNTYNAGKTEHNGIEVSFNGNITNDLAYSIALSRTQQKYKEFSYTCCFPSRNIDVSGNDVAKAPKVLSNIALAYEPSAIEGLRFEIEWEYVGKYFTDETNTNEYEGHDLFNLRTNYRITDNFELYGRIHNIADKLYSTYTSNRVGNTNIDYRPGLPRTFYAGVRLKF